MPPPKAPRPADDFGGKVAEILYQLTNRPTDSPYFYNCQDGSRYVRWGLVESDILAAHAVAVGKLPAPGVATDPPEDPAG